MIYEKNKRYIIPFDDVPSARAQMPEIPVDARRGNFTEVETGFSEEAAVQEAKRCLSCRRCLGCALCWAECQPEAIDFSMPDEELDRFQPQRLLLAGLAERGIPALDLLPPLRAEPVGADGLRHLYHLRDTHINARG